MRNLALSCAISALLAAAGARADTYTILRGTFTPTGGEGQQLSGSLDISLFDTGDRDTGGLSFLRVDDFALAAGDQAFTPSPPVAIGGSPLFFPEPADQILLSGDDLMRLFLRAGGDIVAQGDGEVTFRFLDFASSGRGRAIGQLGEGPLPRRLELHGTLHEVDQTFVLVGADCPVIPPVAIPPIVLPGPSVPLPGDGGAVIIESPGDGGRVIVVPDDGGEVVHSASENLFYQYESFDIGAGESVQFVPPQGSGNVVTRVSGGAATIGGDLSSDGQVILLDPAGVEFGSVTTLGAPSLAELGITAPSGASVGYDEASGELAVTSEGDVLIEGSEIDVPGLTHLRIESGGSITVTGTLVLPPEVRLTLVAATAVVVEGTIEVGVLEIDVPPVVPPLPICVRYQAVYPPQQREIGSFWLVASAARQVDIDVQPWSRRNRVLPGFPQRLTVALLGSAQLDVRDVDPASLRLGEGEAQPVSRWRRASSLRDVNRDGRRDLLARFDVRDAEIAYGDEEVCLVARTLGGETLEGCDGIEALPPRPRRRPWWAPGRARP